MTNLTALISRLRSLEAKATKGPYYVERVDHDDEITYEVHSLVRDDEGERHTFHVVFREGNCLDHGVSAKNQSELYAESRNALPTLLSALEKAVGSMLKVDRLWFDKAVNDCACHDCDMGGSGHPTNPDGHDNYCGISAVHSALDEIEKICELAKKS